MKQHPRRTKWRIFQRWLGGELQRVVWYLCDPHDTWVVEYRGSDGHPYSERRKGSYRMARVAARELRGRIIGHGGYTIRAGPDDPLSGLSFIDNPDDLPPDWGKVK